MEDGTRKKVRQKAIIIAVLSLMLAVTTFALIFSFVEVEDNKFVTGKVEIELNGGQPVFDGTEAHIEPGSSLTKEFTVTNTGTADAYFRIYLENTKGMLKDSLHFSLYDGDKLIYEGRADSLNKENPCVSEELLKRGDTRLLKAVVTMNQDSGNIYQASALTFDITIDAVQAKNNDNIEFE